MSRSATATAGQRLPGAISVGYVDGHAEMVKLDQLWKQYWHLDYVPPATIPAPQ